MVQDEDRKPQRTINLKRAI